MEITGIQPVNTPLYGEPASEQKRENPDVESRADPIGESGSGTTAPSEDRSVERGGATSGDDPANNEDLTQEEQHEVADLERRDLEVKQHERAHLNAAGSLATSGPSYEYTVGPDGKRYAVGGEVQIDVSKEPGEPEATIQKARQIRRAALAPKQPSGADRAIAAQSSRMEAVASREMSAAEVNGEGAAAGEKSEAPESADPASDVAPSGETGKGVPSAPELTGAGVASPPGDAPGNGAIVEPGTFVDLFA